MVEASVAHPEKWIENSLAYDVDVTSTVYLVMTSIVICASFIILVHSNQMHCGTKYSSTRFQTDLSALCALSSGILFLICYSSPTPSKVAIMYDLLGNGLLNLTILLCDSYMFYSRLCAVIKLPKWKRTLVHIYIWTLMALSWFPVYILMAIFVNTNDPVYKRSYYISTTLVSAAILLYNFLITIEFTKILLDAYIPAIARSKTSYLDGEVPKSCQKIRVVAIKSIGHCLTSCTGVLCYSFVPVYGPSLQTFILIIGEISYFVSRTFDVLLLI